MKIFKKDKKLKKQITKLALVKQLKHNELLNLNGNEEKLKKENLNFKNFGLNPLILKGLNSMKLSYATEIQGKVLRDALKYRNILASEKTGSGKTLAYLLPLLELVLALRVRQYHGTCAIVLVPSRELCVQVCGVLGQLCSATNVRYGLLNSEKDEKNIKDEEKMLGLGCTVVIATPGSLLRHLEASKMLGEQNEPFPEYFRCNNVRYLVLDEADRLINDQRLNKIINFLPKERQTLILSATLNLDLDNSLDLINDFSKRAFSLNSFVRINVPVTSGDIDYNVPKNATVDNLVEGYIIVKSSQRILFLYNQIRRVIDKKVMVFFSSPEEVEFYYNFMNLLNINSQTIVMMHSNLSNEMRTSTLIKYSQLKSCFMFCTDVVSRGIDFPQVDLVVQFDVPNDLQSYVHRVGRTARGECEGTAIIILRPEESEMVLGYLKKVSVSLIEFESTELSEIKDFYQQLPKTSQLFKLAGSALVHQMKEYKGSQLIDNLKHIKINDEIINFCINDVPTLPKSLRKDFKNALPNPEI